MNKSLVLIATLVLSMTASAYQGRGDEIRSRNHYPEASRRGGSDNSNTPAPAPAPTPVAPSQGNRPAPGGLPANGSTESEACTDHGKAMTNNNSEVVQWKTSKPNNYHDRAFVSGPVEEVYSDMTGHRHFAIKIGDQPNDRIEVIYQINFGDMPAPHVGDKIIACGDFINSFAQSGGYKPSPDGAIVHWVHKDPAGRHDNGYVVINGTIWGNDPNAQ